MWSTKPAEVENLEFLHQKGKSPAKLESSDVIN